VSALALHLLSLLSVSPALLPPFLFLFISVLFGLGRHFNELYASLAASRMYTVLHYRVLCCVFLITKLMMMMMMMMLNCACAAIDSLPKPVLSPNLIYEDRRKVKQVLSEYVLQQDGNVSPVKQILPLNRGPQLISAVVDLSTVLASLHFA